MTRKNEEELHGVYGFLAVAPTDIANQFRPVKMNEIRLGGIDTVCFERPQHYMFIYSTRPCFDSAPKLDDGHTALLAMYRGNRFEVEYDPVGREIKVNNAPVGRLATFGDIYESIFPKVWPEKLRVRGETYQ